MNRKSLALGMIIPLAAAGAVATASPASADPNHNTVEETADCDNFRDELTLEAKLTPNHARIKLTLTFETNRARANNLDWTAVIRRVNPNRLVERDTDVDFVHSGPRRSSYELETTTVNRSGPDRFRALVRNDRGYVCATEILRFRPIDE